MSLYPPPKITHFEVWSRLPDDLRRTGESPAWATANKPGAILDSFLEGPGFDAEGRLLVVDIPYGRIFRLSPDGANWEVIANYDGWPNGLRFAPDGRLYIADYRHGILRLDPDTGSFEDVVTHRHSESFRGCNDLIFAPDGTLYFTDQGQSGMHRPDGRVYRYDVTSGGLDLLLETGPSPNGLALTPGGDALYVAMTRGNAVWRLPLMADGTVSKVGVFVQLSGGLSGPDGLLVGPEGELFVAHAGAGCVWHFSALGEPLNRIMAPEGLILTNIAFGPDGALYATLSDRGEILRWQI